MKTRRKTQEQMGRDFMNTWVLLDYWMHQIVDDSHPPEVVKAYCELYWPGRTFTVGDEDGLSYLGDAVDDKTGENAYDLLAESNAEVA